MLYPSINDLLKKVDSRYTLVMLVSKRARQLVQGDDSKIETDVIKPVTVALHEVYEDKVEYEKPQINSIK